MIEMEKLPITPAIRVQSDAPLRYYNPKLVTAKVAAPYAGLSEERLVELTKLGYAPCLMIDGSEPHYSKTELRDWVNKNLLVKQEGKTFPIIFKNYAPFEDAERSSVPVSLLSLVDYLKILPGYDTVSCVYFLIKESEVVYVGQTLNLLGRIGTHMSDEGKDFDYVLFLPILKDRLSVVETHFIRLLKPRLNCGRGKDLSTAVSESEVMASVDKCSVGLNVMK